MRCINSLLSRVLLTGLLLFCLLSFCACGKAPPPRATPSPAPTEAPVKPLTFPLALRTGYSTSTDDPRGIALAWMAEELEKQRGGELRMEVFPGGALGSDDELIAGLLTGEVDMTVSSAGNFALYATRIGVSALPFLFEDFSSAWEFIDSPDYQMLCRDLEPFNMHVLAFFDNGFRCITTSLAAGEITSVESMKGLNIRTPDNQILMETMSELGARPRSFPFARLREALVTGEFDAQENPIPVIYNNRLYQVQHYLSLTNHSYDAMPLVIRQDLWEQLSDSHRKLLSSLALEAQSLNREMVRRQTEEYVSLLQEAGMVISTPDRRPFIEATRGVLQVFSRVYGSRLVRQVQALQDASVHP